ncbi:MAG TPA: sigma 54-interacting transcriptional regulator [Kofleriaceae bacterium]|nr:sigma 54-interacting transcriptional regulator [Kofleriaceae bacterium]
MGRGRTQDPPSELELAVVVRDGISVTPLPASGAVTLGRDEECDVRIDSRSVSRRHAVLHLGEALRIQDLGSVNGTFVRDARNPVDTLATHPLRKLSKETLEISVGERVNLGSIPIVVRRVAPVPRRDGPPAGDGAVVEDPAMRALHDQVARAARSPISVLLLGETGVGKEVLARAIHDRSPRARGPFLELHCAALPPSLLEAELFGHEKSAFTGASQARAGLLEAADGGTVFLDEVGELPAPVQVKLLRVLEDHKVLRIGGRTPKKLDVRFVAATNRDLEAEVAAGRFRQDLYFRLNGVSFVIPPLRERTAEIAPLAERFLAAAGATLDRTAPLRLSPDALRDLEGYAWPGNVRELRNAIDRAAVLASGDIIMPADFPGHITRITGPGAAARLLDRASDRASDRAGERMEDRTPDPTSDPMGSTLPPPDSSSERQRILDALESCAGNQTRAAKLLGISLRTLVNRLTEHDIPRPRARK